MTFRDILAEVIDWLQQDGRISYRALQRQFDLDDAYLQDIKDAILYAHPVTDDGRGLVWTGAPASPKADRRIADEESRFHALLPDVIARLQRDRRVSYRTLKYVFGIDNRLLGEIREELRLRCLATDEACKVLVWAGETPPSVQPGEVDSSLQNMVATATSSPASLAPRSHVLATDTTTNRPPASAEETLVGLLSDGQRTVSQTTRSTSEAERRQLTVMFCDLVGSTDLSGRLDPEDLREVVRAYQETAAEVIGRYEGHIAQYLGDGLLIYFGFPVAHEDDAQRAIYTGLGIPEAMAALNTRLQADYGIQLAVRIGIHTGPVVVGEMGGGGRRENLALGETPNIAARLEGLAKANTVVISPVTAQLARRSFVLEELALHELKGVSEPMMLYTVVGPRESEQDDLEGMMSGGFDVLVGRDEEIGLLLRRWEQSKDGLGQVVLLSGEAGIGKSSLVDGLRAHARQEGLTRITFRCSPYHTNSAFHPIIEQVQRALGWQPEDTSDTQLAKLEQMLEHTSLPLEEAVPLLASLLSLPLPKGRYPALSMRPQQQRQQTQDVLVAWLLEEAERQPVLAVWEDLHWADPSTLENLGLLVEQAPTATMLHVLTFRPEFEPPWPSRSHLTPITLNRLERLQTVTLAQRLAGGKRLPEEVVAHIVAKTDGVPLYVEEMTKALLESGDLKEHGDGYELTQPLDTSIPATLQDSLMARLDNLDTAKGVAQLGATIGRRFSYNLLQAVSTLSETRLRSELDKLVDAELIYQSGVAPNLAYLFKHALVQDTAYQSLLRSTRQGYHRRIAEVLEARFPETQPELLGYHFTEAGLNEQAVRYWHRAGQQASQRSAHREAISHLRMGLTLLASLPDTRERVQQELSLLLILGPSVIAVEGYAAPNVERAYVRAQELCQQMGDSLQLFPVMRGLTLYYQMRGQTQTALELGEELLCLAQRQPESGYLMLAHFQLGMVLFYRGEPVLAQAQHAQVLDIYAPHEHRALATRFGIDLGVASHSWLVWEQWQMGHPDQAMQHSQAAHKLAQEALHPFSLGFALVCTTVLHQHSREVLAALEWAETLMTLATSQEFAYFLSIGTVLHGWALAMQGQCKDGVAEIRQGLDAELDTGAVLYQPYFLGLLAEAHGEDGCPEEGLHTLVDALTMMGHTEVCFYEAELHRLKGKLLLQQSSDNATEAESCFKQAISVAQSQQAKSWELRAATSLAKLRQSQGKRQEAYDLLAPVYGWFTEGFDTADLQDAKALLDELEVP